MTEPLNSALMQGSAVIHREAERVPFMVAFFKGELPRDAYAAYLGRLWYVYEALESSAAALREHQTLGWVYTPELFRLDKLGEDVAAYTGADWQQRITPTPATKAYADRVRDVAQSEPHRFVAHHWLRYLGYVLGQDILNKLVTKAYGAEAARAFYSFPAIDDPRAYLGRYHEKMNAMPLDEEQRAAVVDEGNRAFALQIDVTEELAADFGIGDATKEETEQLLDELKAEHP